MAPGLYMEFIRVVDEGTGVGARHRELGQGCRHIEDCNRVRCTGYDASRLLHACEKREENFHFDCQRLFGGLSYPLFEASQFHGSEPHTANDRLPVNKFMLPRTGLQRFAIVLIELDEMAQKIVVANFKRPDAGLFGIGGLKASDDTATFVPQLSRLFQIMPI